ncbi:MAG: TIR domain-containing protein [Gammaproteobacteria bacterium]|nr:TIR domain-containing protein [Gammaproteobacteria bacterium]
MPPEIFASYSREDQAQVFPIVDKLRERGLNIWIDQEGIHGAKLWSQEIVNAIESSKVFILFASAKAFHSKNVTKELALASESDKHILPIFIEDAEIPAAMKYQLAGIQHLVHEQGQTDQTADNILRTLGNLDIQSTEPQPTPSQPSATKPASKTLLIATALVIALLALIYVFKSSTPTMGNPVVTQPEAKPLDKNRIVVLPFKNIGTAGENDHIVEGIVVDLNTMLSNVDGLKVIGSVSAKTYKDTEKSPTEIGQELNTGTLIQGSIQKSGPQLKINVQVINTTSGEISWAKNFEGIETDLFSLQSQIVKSVGENLDGVVVDESRLNALKKSGTTNPKAYDLVQRAKSLMDGNSKVSTIKAIELYEQAIEIDSNYADAHALLGVAHSDSTGVSIAYPKVAYSNAKKAYEKCLELDSKNIIALAGLAELAVLLEWDLEKAKRLLEKAEAINSNNPNIIITYCQYHKTIGDTERMAEMALRGIEIDPKAAFLHQMYSNGLYFEGDKENAEKHNLIALSLSPGFQWAIHERSVILLDSNKFKEAEQLLLQGIKDDPDNPVTVMSLGVVYWRMGKKEKAYELLSDLLHRSHHEYIKADIIARFYAVMRKNDKALLWVSKMKELKEMAFMVMHQHPWFNEVYGLEECQALYKEAGLFEVLFQYRIKK